MEDYKEPIHIHKGGIFRMTKKLYNKQLKKFKFIYPVNYNEEIYRLNENYTMDIKPIPIIVELKRDEGKKKNLDEIRIMQDLIEKDLKVATFKFEHGDLFVVQQLMSPIATLLGIKLGLKKLEEKERKR